MKAEPAMERIPLFFHHAGLVAGRGFIAHVAIEGRCILERTAEDFVSMLGVNPSAVAGQGTTQAEAYRDLTDNIEHTVSDISEEAPTFQELKAQVEGFVLGANSRHEAAWRAAVADVRAGKVDRSAFARTLGAEHPPSVTVELVAVEGAVGPYLNRQDEEQPRVAVG